MTEPENFLARWSRRKRKVAEEEKAREARSVPPSPAGGGSASDAVASRGGVDYEASPPPAGLRPATSPVQGEVEQEVAASTEPPFDPSRLPPIESITAETDIRAFLAPGVPAEISRAALRRAWAADPKIRDFVGLSENAWDFNAPGAAPGFGTLEPTDEMRRMIDDMVGSNLPRARSEQPAVADRNGSERPAPESPAELAAGNAGSPPPETPAIRASENLAPESAKVSGDAESAAQSHIASQHDCRDDEPSQIADRRPHGRALPK
jgi:hypothetical protein